MKAKLLTIFFLLVTSQVFAEECKGTDVSKWDNCISETEKRTTNVNPIDNPEMEFDPQEIYDDITELNKSKGRYKKGKKNGFFIEENTLIERRLEGNAPVSSFTSRSYSHYGIYKDDMKVGLWEKRTEYDYQSTSICTREIGNYIDNKEKNGIWINSTSCNDSGLISLTKQIKKLKCSEENSKDILGENNWYGGKIILYDGLEKCDQLGSNCDSIMLYRKNKESLGNIGNFEEACKLLTSYRSEWLKNLGISTYLNIK